MPSMGDGYDTLGGSGGASSVFFHPSLSSAKRYAFLAGLALLVVAVAVLGIALGVTLNAGDSDNDNGDGNSDSGTGVAPVPPPPSPPVDLPAAMDIKNLMAHLAQLEAIAGQHPNAVGVGSRAPQFGYNASAAYVMAQLAEKAPGLVVSQQYFKVEVFENVAPPQLAENAPDRKALEVGREYVPCRGYAGAVSVTGVVREVANLGCETADWALIQPGDLALVKRGVCSFSSKVEKGGDANAAAVLIYNDGTSSDRMAPFSVNVGESKCPSAIVAYWIGVEWASSPTPVNLTFSMHERGWNVTTMNVLAETPNGDPDNIVMFGSHLDGVEAGPGINDDGSGSTTNLELAIQLANLEKEGMVTIRNKVRFGWWGAEELGLIGSRFYVEQLNKTDPAALKKIALNWNMDMLGSPNGVYGIHSGSSAPAAVRAQSTVIQDMASAYADKEGLPWGPSAMTGGSDYWWFLQYGIPAGGVATGAGGIKTDDERAKFGGLANTPYDPCYHQACDTTDNIDQVLLERTAKLSAHALQYVAEKENVRAWLNGQS